MVELIIDGQTLELDDSTKIKYTKQISDIFNISKIKSSYTNSFSIPRTPKNTQIFQGLGLVGSTSKIPYQKVPVTLKDNGFDVVRNGWLDVKETTDSYKINIIDGCIDFFKDIENINIGDLDLSEINHTKTLESVIESFSNDFYRYIIADYNGKTFTGGLFEEINIDYIVPSARYKYLIEKIFSSFGWTCSGSIFSNEDYLDSWITFPKSTEAEEDEMLLIAKMNKGQFTSTSPVPVSTSTPWGDWVFNNVASWDTYSLDEGTLLNNWRYQVSENNIYNINIKSKGHFRYKNNSWLEFNKVFRIAVKRNGVTLGQPLNVFNVEDIYETTYVGYLNAGDIIDFEFLANTSMNEIPVSLNLQFAEVNISKTPDVSFTQAFEKFKITDFFTDFIRRFGLTVIPDNDSKNLHFYTLSEVINLSNSIDWSGKYVRRINETYLYGSYAQNNYYRHKYNGDNEDFNDGILLINNKNLQNEKTIATSPIYSRTNDITVFNSLNPIIKSNAFVYPIWEKEPKETESGIEISYKTLSGRFYLIKSTDTQFPIFLSSELTGQREVVPSLPIANSYFTEFSDLIPKYYEKYYQLLNNCIVHKIEVLLSVLDLINIDFSKPIYFASESSYYLINKIDFESGKVSTIEAVKINI